MALKGTIAPTDALEMKWVQIKPGERVGNINFQRSFMMGSPASETNRASDETQHRVTLTQAFEIMTTEVTQKMWFEVMKDTDNKNPSRFDERTHCEDWTDQPGVAMCPNNPVEQVSWSDIAGSGGFLEKLNHMKSGDGYTYRLPTEAEWEYAARAGTTTPFNLGENISPAKVNYNGNYPYKNAAKGEYRQKTVAVASLGNANAWGLSDMHGNVWEWVKDWYGGYPSSAVTDPQGPSSGSNRVLRGGSWYSRASFCRSAFRSGSGPSERFDSYGFRLVRTKN